MQKFLISLLIVTALVGYAHAGADGKCRTLALDSGGHRAPWQAGAIRGLIADLGAEAKYDAVSAISFGSFNGALFAQNPVGSEDLVSQALLDLWNNITDKDIYQSWDGGILEGVFKKTGVYDNSPTQTYLNSLISDGYQSRPFYTGATNVSTGAFEEYLNTGMTKEDFIMGLFASSSFPIAFPVVEWADKVLTDANIKMGINVYPLVNYCRNQGYTDENIIVDGVFSYGSDLNVIDASNYHPLQVIIRFIEIYIHDISFGNIYQAKLAYPNVNFRYFVTPQGELPFALIPIDFDHDDITKMLGEGLNDAKTCIAKGPGATLKGILDQYTENMNKEYGMYRNGAPSQEDVQEAIEFLMRSQ